MSDTAAIILAAGQSKRMKSARSKVLHEIGGRALIHHVLHLCAEAGLARIAVVVSPGAEELEARIKAVAPEARTAVQDPPLGTGHAVGAGIPALEGFAGDLFVLYGDTPLVTSQTLARMSDERAAGADLVVLGFHAAAPGMYGRIVLDEAGNLDRIVEAKDAGPEVLALDFVNSGVMLADAGLMADLLGAVSNDNAAGEYYLTDIVAIARGRGLTCRAISCPEDEVLGVNSRADLAIAEGVLQNRLRAQVMAAG